MLNVEYWVFNITKRNIILSQKYIDYYIYIYWKCQFISETVQMEMSVIYWKKKWIKTVESDKANTILHWPTQISTRDIASFRSATMIASTAIWHKRCAASVIVSIYIVCFVCGHSLSTRWLKGRLHVFLAIFKLFRNSHRDKRRKKHFAKARAFHSIKFSSLIIPGRHSPEANRGQQSLDFMLCNLYKP